MQSSSSRGDNHLRLRSLPLPFAPKHSSNSSGVGENELGECDLLEWVPLGFPLSSTILRALRYLLISTLDGV